MFFTLSALLLTMKPQAGYTGGNMDFLIRAEKYAEARGDALWFKNIYTGFREYNSVNDSVWKALSYLYSNEVADLLEFQ